MAAHTPLIPYLKIADELRNRISEGVYEVGGRLPPARELADELGVARNTVGSAIRLLREEGLVTPVPGRGTVVEARPKTTFEPSPEMNVLMEKLDSLQSRVEELDQRLQALEP